MGKSPRQIGAGSEPQELAKKCQQEDEEREYERALKEGRVKERSIEHDGVAWFFRTLLGFLQDRDTCARWPGDPGSMNALVFWNWCRLDVRDWIEDHHPNPNVASRVLSDLDKRFRAFFEAIGKRDPARLPAGSDWDWQTDPARLPGWALIGYLAREMQRFERLSERGAVAQSKDRTNETVPDPEVPWSEPMGTKETAKKLCVHPSTVRRQIKAGKLTAHKVGSRFWELDRRQLPIENGEHPREHL